MPWSHLRGQVKKHLHPPFTDRLSSLVHLSSLRHFWYLTFLRALLLNKLMVSWNRLLRHFCFRQVGFRALVLFSFQGQSLICVPWGRCNGYWNVIDVLVEETKISQKSWWRGVTGVCILTNRVELHHYLETNNAKLWRLPTSFRSYSRELMELLKASDKDGTWNLQRSL